MAGGQSWRDRHTAIGLHRVHHRRLKTSRRRRRLASSRREMCHWACHCVTWQGPEDDVERCD
jgi:hypothetical protein